VQRLLVAVTLRPGKAEEAAELIRSGPPYELADTGLTRHGVYLSAQEAVFLFEGPSVERLVGRLVNDPVSAGMFSPWVGLTQGPPRLVLEHFAWTADGATLTAA
jgi:hypothetical protein